MNVVEPLGVLHQTAFKEPMIKDRACFLLISHRNDGDRMVVDKTRELVLAEHCRVSRALAGNYLYHQKSLNQGIGGGKYMSEGALSSVDCLKYAH